MPRIVEYQQRTEAPDPARSPLAQARATDITVDSGMGSVVRGLGVVEQAVQKQDEEQAKAWSAGVLSRARLDWTQQLLDRQASAEPGAPNFTPQITSDFDEYANKTIETAPTRKAKAYLAGRMNEFKYELGEKAMVFEAKARIDYRSDQINTSIDNTAKLMNTDPSQFKPALAEQLATIQALSLPPIQKSALEEKAKSRLSEAAVWSQIQKSPTAFLQSIGFLNQVDPATGKIRPSSGNIAGATGNDAFDIMPFDKRSHMFEQAVRLKSQIDADGDRAVAAAKKEASDGAMRDLWGMWASKKLTRQEIEQRAPLLSPPEYHSILQALEKPEANQKNDPGTFRALQEKLYQNPTDAVAYAFQGHKAGLISNETLSSTVEHARALERQEGPKSPYERARQYVTLQMKPSEVFHDPVASARYADAVDEFDKWNVSNPNAAPTDVDKAARDVVDRYKFINLNDTVLSLPLPHYSAITRQAADVKKLGAEIQNAGITAQKKRDTGAINQQQYEDEMRLLNRWRRAAQGGK